MAATEVTPLPAGGSTVINLLDVKEEPIDECVHTPVDAEGNVWPCMRDLEVMIWRGNQYADNSVANLIQTLDATLFQLTCEAGQRRKDLCLLERVSVSSFP